MIVGKGARRVRTKQSDNFIAGGRITLKRKASNPAGVFGTIQKSGLAPGLRATESIEVVEEASEQLPLALIDRCSRPADYERRIASYRYERVKDQSAVVGAFPRHKVSSMAG